MAKSRQVRSSVTRNAPHLSKRDANHGVREFYELGLKVLKADAKSTKRGAGVRNWDSYKEFEKSYTRNQFEKARMFALLYTQEDLSKLLALGSKGGMPLGRRHVTYLLSVKNRSQRLKLQKRASKYAWPTRQLALEIKKEHGKKSVGGRRQRSATTKDETLFQIESMSSQWIRWYRQLRSAALLDKRHAAARVLADISPLMEELHGSVAKAIRAAPLASE